MNGIMNSDWLCRNKIILGDDKSARLASAHVLLVGLGGVGSWAAEMLCRSGVGAFTLVDADVVDVTNINRQMPALHTTVGRPKCDVVAERLLSINPDVRLTIKSVFVDVDNIPNLLGEYKYDYVVDAIDSMNSKAALIAACWERNIKIVSSMGAGAKMSLEHIRVNSLWRSEQCALAKNLRRMLREYKGKYDLPVVFGSEPPMKSAVHPNPQGGKPIIGSIGYYTAVFGCYLAEYVINDI